MRQFVAAMGGVNHPPSAATLRLYPLSETAVVRLIRPQVLHLLALMALLTAGHPAAAADRPVVAAASDLQFALEDVAQRFAEETGERLRLSFGSSGNLRRQIAQGGPYELFLSADEHFVLDLHREGRTEDEGVLYAVGRIVLIAPPGSPVDVHLGLAGLGRALEQGRIRRFAIANPEHAPYGRAARQALEKAGLWGALQSRLVLGENVSQAAQFALSGTAQGGIVAYSLALAPPLAARGRHALIPAAEHAPLRQRMALIRGAGPTARDFYSYLQSPPARAVLARYGFVPPDEAD